MKHAIMIMAHANFSQLRMLVLLLDYPNFDIYIHVNSKSIDWNDNLLSGCVSRAGLYFVPRVAISYCNYTQIEAIKSLLNEAVKKKHDYYHIISGADMPLMKHNEFNAFFSHNRGKEFVGFSQKTNIYLAQHYWFFSDKIRTSSSLISKLYIKLNQLLQKIQSSFGINVLKNYSGDPRKGYDWWSISHGAALYVLEQETEFKRHFQYAYCPSEWLMQTILYNSDFRYSLYDIHNECRGSMRHIDWNRGQPYVWKNTDFEELVSSQRAFGRKFDSNIDNEIIEKIKQYLKY